jgi:hypothetical protein
MTFAKSAKEFLGFVIAFDDSSLSHRRRTKAAGDDHRGGIDRRDGFGGTKAAMWLKTLPEARHSWRKWSLRPPSKLIAWLWQN